MSSMRQHQEGSLRDFWRSYPHLGSCFLSVASERSTFTFLRRSLTSSSKINSEAIMSSMFEAWAPLTAGNYSVISAHWKNSTAILGVRNPEFVGLLSVEIQNGRPLQPMTIAGGAPGYRNGSLQESQFGEPISICQGLDNSLLVADSSNHMIRIVNSTQVNTLLGTGQAGNADGPNGQLNQPFIVAQSQSHIIIVERGRSNALRVYDPNSRILSTLQVPHSVRGAFPLGDAAFGLFADAGRLLKIDLRGPNYPTAESHFILPSSFDAVHQFRTSERIFYVRGTRLYSYESDNIASLGQLPVRDTKDLPAMVHVSIDNQVLVVTGYGAFFYTQSGAALPHSSGSASSIGYTSSGTPLSTMVPPYASAPSSSPLTPSSSIGSFSTHATHGSTNTPPPTNMQPGYDMSGRSGSGSNISGGGYPSPSTGGYPPNTAPNSGYPPTNTNFNPSFNANNSRPASGQYPPSGFPPGTSSPYDMPGNQSPIVGRTPSSGGGPTGGYGSPSNSSPNIGYVTNTNQPTFTPQGYPPQSPVVVGSPMMTGAMGGSPIVGSPMGVASPMGVGSPMGVTGGMMVTSPPPMATVVSPIQAPLATMQLSPAYSAQPHATIITTTTTSHRPPPGSTIGKFWKWEFDLANHTFTAYDASVSDAIDAAYHNGDFSAVITIRGQEYEVDLNTPAPRQYLMSDRSKSRRVKAPKGYTLPKPR